MTEPYVTLSLETIEAAVDSALAEHGPGSIMAAMKAAGHAFADTRAGLYVQPARPRLFTLDRAIASAALAVAAFALWRMRITLGCCKSRGEWTGPARQRVRPGRPQAQAAHV